jgi:hypothetical protein
LERYFKPNHNDHRSRKKWLAGRAGCEVKRLGAKMRIISTPFRPGRASSSVRMGIFVAHRRAKARGIAGSLGPLSVVLAEGKAVKGTIATEAAARETEGGNENVTR